MKHPKNIWQVDISAHQTKPCYESARLSPCQILIWAQRIPNADSPIIEKEKKICKICRIISPDAVGPCAVQAIHGDYLARQLEEVRKKKGGRYSELQMFRICEYV
jgi:hypothetical protein